MGYLLFPPLHLRGGREGGYSTGGRDDSDPGHEISAHHGRITGWRKFFLTKKNSHVNF